MRSLWTRYAKAHVAIPIAEPSRFASYFAVGVGDRRRRRRHETRVCEGRNRLPILKPIRRQSETPTEQGLTVSHSPLVDISLVDVGFSVVEVVTYGGGGAVVVVGGGGGGAVVVGCNLAEYYSVECRCTLTCE